MDNKNQTEKMEVRVKVTVEQWGGTEMTYIRHYESVEEMEKDERETGIKCEILGNVWN